jgi:natural product precursor
MKKLSLKNAKNTLSRKEMKAIAGGYGSFNDRGCNYKAECPSGCAFFYGNGPHGYCNNCCIA